MNFFEYTKIQAESQGLSLVQTTDFPAGRLGRSPVVDTYMGYFTNTILFTLVNSGVSSRMKYIPDVTGIPSALFPSQTIEW